MGKRKLQWLPVDPKNPTVALHPNPNSQFPINELKKRIANASDEDRAIYERMLEEFKKG